MRYFPDNNTIRFITQSPQQIRLQGQWTVALTEIRIPLTIPHLFVEEGERLVIMLSETYNSNDLNSRSTKLDVCYANPGIYKDVLSLIDHINNLECCVGHISFKLLRGNYVAIARVCNSTH